MSELEQEQNKLALKQIAGNAQHIEINERTLEAYRKAYADKGLVITREKEYSFDKEQTSYSDSLDALRLSLKGYNIKKKIR